MFVESFALSKEMEAYGKALRFSSRTVPETSPDILLVCTCDLAVRKLVKSRVINNVVFSFIGLVI